MKRLILSLIALCFLSVSADAASRFGVCTTTCTWDGASTAMWSATSGGATGASVPGSADTVTFDAATCVGGTTCTITVNTSVAVTSIIMGACTATTTGCILDFSVNNNSVALTGAFNISGTGTRTLKLGSSVVTLTTVSGTWNAAVTTNLTFTPGTSNIVLSGVVNSNRSFSTGPLTYATVTLAANTGSGIVTFADAGVNPTFGTLVINGPNFVTFRFGATFTVTNAITWSGSSTKQIFIASNSSSNATISSGANAAITWANIQGLSFAGAGTHAATNSFKDGRTTGITVTVPTSIGAGSACILGGWLLWRDFDTHELNDNFPAFLDKAA